MLDLFAGTGAMGLEALSRGAAFALFVDDGAEARGLIRENVEALGAGGQSRLFRRDATRMGPAGAERAVLPRFLRPALRPRPRRAGARLLRGGRLAQGGCARRRRGSAGD